jgi:hypothetical protein
MDETAWQRYMADFMQEVRAALPGIEIVHNTIWTVGDATPDLRRQLSAADYIELERGFNDAGIVGGASKFGWQTLASFIDRRHADGRAVILDGYADSAAGRLYGLASYFLLSSGRDALANDAATRPDAFWKGYGVGIGAALGPRYRAGGVWRRDFAGGVVLVNEPGAPARTVEVGPGLRDIDGVGRSSVTLGAASGEVLLGAAATTGGPTAEEPRKRRTRASIRARARKRGVRIRGRVSGAAGGSVRIVVERRRSRRWATVRRAHAAVKVGGAYARRVTPLARGRYRVRAVYLTATSSYQGFRIRP